MLLGNVSYGDLVCLRVSLLNSANSVYRVSIRTEQQGGSFAPEREFVSWVTRLSPAPQLALNIPLDMRLYYDMPFEQIVLALGLRTAFLGYFGFAELPPI
jgi:hypothetical protein